MRKGFQCPDLAVEVLCLVCDFRRCEEACFHGDGRTVRIEHQGLAPFDWRGPHGRIRPRGGRRRRPSNGTRKHFSGCRTHLASCW